MLFHNFELMNCDKICSFDSRIESVFLSPLMCYMRGVGGRGRIVYITSEILNKYRFL